MLGCTWPRLESPWCQPQGTENWLSSRRHLSKITVSLGDAADPSSPTAASTSCGSLGVHSSCFWSGLSHRWNLGEVWRSRSKSLLVDLVRLMLISSLCTKQRREGGYSFLLSKGDSILLWQDYGLWNLGDLGPQTLTVIYSVVLDKALNISESSELQCPHLYKWV